MLTCSSRYSNYLNDDKAASRQSGVGALGMGLMNMSSDDEEDDDDVDAYTRRKPVQHADSPGSKHAALAAATASPAKSQTPSPPPQYIAAPQPGYAAPIAALNFARPEPAATRAPPALQISPYAEDPFNTPAPPSPTPSMLSSTPHPLQPPVTPITPVFARPTKAAITFSEVAIPRPVMRSNNEHTLLPARGEKGDDFWRRFSMVAKEENKKPAALKERSVCRSCSYFYLLTPVQSVAQEDTERHYALITLGLDNRCHSSRREFLQSLYSTSTNIAQCIGGGIGIGWYFTHNKPEHQAPTVFGGAANEAPVISSSMPPIVSGSSTIRKVTPTFTLEHRTLATPHPHAHKRRISH